MTSSYKIVLAVLAAAEARRFRGQSDHRKHHHHRDANAHEPHGHHWRFRVHNPMSLLSLGGSEKGEKSGEAGERRVPEWLNADFQRLDSNKDGLLSEQEFVQGHEGFDRESNLAIMKAIDLNNDGSISDTEYIRFVEDPSAGMIALARQKFDRMDVDGNGVLEASELHTQRIAHGSGPAILPTVTITFDEFYKHLANRMMTKQAQTMISPQTAERIRLLKIDFSENDRNHDNFLTEDELEKFLGTLPGYSRIMDIADTDHDGKIGEREFLDFMQVGVVYLAEKEFAHVDKNGDGKIDMTEYNFKTTVNILQKHF